MRTYTIRNGQQAGTLLAWWFVFTLFAANSWNPFGVLYFIGAPFLLIVPGALTLVLLRIANIDWAARALLSVALSVLELMALGLLGNALMPVFGELRPLDTAPVIWAVSTLFLALLTLTWWRFETITLSTSFNDPYVRRNAIFLMVPLVLVLMSAAGAYMLNSGGTNTLTLLMLLGAAVYSWSLFRNAERVASFVVPGALYLLSLALLLMTSLRGWFVSGHDIQREFFTFQLAKSAGHWSMAVYQDAYNACMSITVLPTILANMLHMPDAYVYKVFFQLIFAAAPLVAYLIARKWLSAPLAFLAGFFVISFPTFFQDMPFLARQEIAFLFYGAMLYVLFEDAFSKRSRTSLFLLFGLGVVLSHYSTTYTILFVLAATSVTAPLAIRVMRYLRTKHAFRDSAIGSPIPTAPLPERRVTVSKVLILFLAAMLWTSAITNTDAHARDVLGSTWQAVMGGVESERSVDVLTLFSFGRVKHTRTLDEYVQHVVEPHRALEPDAYYAPSTYEQYRLAELEPTTLPYTSLGALLQTSGVSIAAVVTFTGQLLAKLMQAAILIGFLYVLVRRAWIFRMNTEFYVLAGYALLFVALCTALPVLSIEYGLFRALMQSLFLLAPLVVVGMLALGTALAWFPMRFCRAVPRLRNRAAAPATHAQFMAGILGVLFFIYATGFMTQLVGGNVPPMHLNNVGDDYDHYVTTTEELEAIIWLKARLDQEAARMGVPPTVYADRYGHKKLRAFVLSHVSEDMLPASIRKDSYVFVGPAVLLRGTATVRYEGALIKYAYPIEFLDEQKEVVYDNGAVRIYR